MINVAIVGAGQGGTSLLRVLANTSQVEVVGVADKDLDAPGIGLARALGVPVTADFREVAGDPGVDIIVHATKDPGVLRAVEEARSPRAVVVEAPVMNLLMSLVEEEEKLIREMSQAQREREVFLNSTHDGILGVNAAGRVTLFNAAAERITGLSARNVLGAKARDVIPNTRLHIVLETGKSELNQQQKMNGTTIVTNRVPVRDEEGRIIGAMAVFRDITEFKALAEEITNLKEIQEMLGAIINATQDAISVVDAQGNGLLINPAYTRLTGLTEADVIGKPATVDIAEGESMHFQVLRTRRPVRGASMKVGPKKKEVIVHCAPILVDGQLKGSVGVVHDVSEIRHLTEELEKVKRLVRRLEAKYTFDEIVAQSPMMQAAVEQARRAAGTPATVLLRGESGTGKELFAHAIHNASPRRSGQFIRVNCAAIADTLLESELFGYVDGAFTGARRGGRKGLFEEAGGGTIFLDEIGDVSLPLQAKLLRVLQEKEIRRVGDSKPFPADVRVIAATNAHLEQAMASGTFREDLYYRLNVIPIFIPPLRHRKEDIPQLVDFLIKKFDREYGRNVENVSPRALEIIYDYDWPGNVRELENIIGRAIINMRYNDTTILPEHLPSFARGAFDTRRGKSAPGRPSPAGKLSDIVAGVEKEAITAVLAECRGNKTEAARRLGIATRSLYYKIEKLKIKEPAG